MSDPLASLCGIPELVLDAPLCELVAEEEGLAFWSVVLLEGVVLDGFAFWSVVLLEGVVLLLEGVVLDGFAFWSVALEGDVLEGEVLDGAVWSDCGIADGLDDVLDGLVD